MGTSVRTAPGRRPIPVVDAEEPQGNFDHSEGNDFYCKVAVGQIGECIVVCLDTGNNYNIVTQQRIKQLLGC